MTAPRITPLADDAWCVALGDPASPDDAPVQRVHALAARVRAEAPAWLRDLVPTWASVAVFFDPDATTPDAVHAWLQARCAAADDAVAAPPARVVEIPVCYGGAYGADLDDAAAALGLDAATLAARHAAGTYTVGMIGFAPGFPYLAGLDPSLALPRLATPRTRVPAGSVAIGGAQTGIYPRDSPGGWRLLGRTPLRLFDPARAEPALLAPGDRVRFVPIDVATFTRLEPDA